MVCAAFRLVLFFQKVSNRGNGGVVHSHKGGTSISLDDDVGDETIPSSGKNSAACSASFAELVQDLANLDKKRQQSLQQATDMVRKTNRNFDRAFVSKMNVYHHAKRGNRHIIVIDDAFLLRWRMHRQT